LNQQSLELHFHISNHFAIDGNENHQRDDQALIDYYALLGKNPNTQDISKFGLGFVAAAQGDFARAIDLYYQVQDPDQKYLNYFIAQAYRDLDQLELTEKYLWREIAVNGFISASAKELVSLYVDQNRVDQMRLLVANSQIAPFVELPIHRKIAYLTGDIIGYLELTVLGCYQALKFTPSMVAVLIGLVWINYFRRITFSKSPMAAFYSLTF
jgi:tetratricopeptide (TPR) repeat protein